MISEVWKSATWWGCPGVSAGWPKTVVVIGRDRGWLGDQFTRLHQSDKLAYVPFRQDISEFVQVCKQSFPSCLAHLLPSRPPALCEAVERALSPQVSSNEAGSVQEPSGRRCEAARKVHDGAQFMLMPPTLTFLNLRLIEGFQNAVAGMREIRAIIF